MVAGRKDGPNINVVIDDQAGSGNGETEAYSSELETGPFGIARRVGFD